MQTHQSYQFQRAVWRCIDIIFPPFCVGCGKPGIRWCEDCMDNVQLIQPPVCEICGYPQSHQGICSKCSMDKPVFARLRSWSLYIDPVKRALLNLKYHNDISLGHLFAVHMAAMLEKQDWPIDVIIPIPLGKARLKERGYNQAGVIARPLAILAGLAYEPRALIRKRETISQVGLEQHERRENVSGAFAASQKYVLGKTVLVIDDVATTGATLAASAEALYLSGAKEVFAMTVARA